MGFEAACDLLRFEAFCRWKKKKKKKNENLLFVFLGCLLPGVSLEIV